MHIMEIGEYAIRIIAFGRMDAPVLPTFLHSVVPLSLSFIYSSFLSSFFPFFLHSVRSSFHPSFLSYPLPFFLLSASFFYLPSFISRICLIVRSYTLRLFQFPIRRH